MPVDVQAVYNIPLGALESSFGEALFIAEVTSEICRQVREFPPFLSFHFAFPAQHLTTAFTAEAHIGYGQFRNEKALPESKLDRIDSEDLFVLVAFDFFFWSSRLHTDGRQRVPSINKEQNAQSETPRTEY
jgi:hypothetical protein